MEDELQFPIATDTLVELILSGASPGQVDKFLQGWALHSVYNFTSFMPVSYESDEILAKIDDRDASQIVSIAGDDDEEED